MYFDIGANVGKWSLANKSTCNKIIAVEASPITYKNMKENIKSIPNIIGLNYAVCNTTDDYIDFYHCNSDTLSTINKDWLFSPNSRFCNYDKVTQIRCIPITLDKLIEQYGEPELIKIDVEGGEYECICSLSKKVNNLCFEWASETNEITFKCLDYLNNLGYTNFSLQLEDNYLYRPVKYTDKDAIIYYLKNNTTAKKEWGMIWAK
jgi:FkbM family methyltransferase